MFFFDSLFDLNRDNQLNIAEKTLQNHFITHELYHDPPLIPFDDWEDSDDQDDDFL